jgi:hypothetical protein
MGSTNPCGLLAALIRRQLWHYVTESDEDAASQRLKQHLYGQDAQRRPPPTPMTPEPAALSKDAFMVRELHRELARAGFQGDALGSVHRLYPEWTRARWDHAVAELAMAQQSFGGSVSVAVRSAPVRELLQLYADNTGQKSSSLLAQQVHSASLTQSGGSLYQSATYQNGTPYTYASNLPTLGPSGGALPTSNSMSGPVIVQVSPEATQNLWATGTAMAIAGNPRGVAQANVNGSGQSAARLNNANLQFSPSTITS